MKRDRVEPLYRKENTKGWLNRIYKKGGQYKWRRYSERDIKAGKKKEGMQEYKVGWTAYNYNPLFHYLLGCIGKDVNEVRKAVQSRLNSMEPFNIMVHDDGTGQPPTRDSFRFGENSYWSQLYVDGDNKIQAVNPDLSNVHPAYGWQWGASFNGKPLGTKNWLRNPDEIKKEED